MLNSRLHIRRVPQDFKHEEIFVLKKFIKTFLPIVLIVLIFVDTASAARIKDLSSIKGVRGNQLIGFGLVIGLAGTGDSATNVFFSIQSVYNMLKKMGVNIPSAEVESLKFKNVATVMVTAELPSFARQGDRIDVTVSSVGDSKSLQGGTLLMTPLKGPDSNTYAVAQGPLSIGGFEVPGGAKTQKNHLTVGRVANGALIERELSHEFNAKAELIFALKKTDFTTARRISQAINEELKDQSAFVIDGRTVKVEVPKYYRNNSSELISRIEKLDVEPDVVARVIVDERTGTVVMGENVRISTVAVAHGALFIQIKGEPAADQPPPLAEEGEATDIPGRIRVPVEEGEDKLLVVSKGAALGDIVNGLNAIGVTPRDLIAILQSIKASGALHAELVII